MGHSVDWVPPSQIILFYYPVQLSQYRTSSAETRHNMHQIVAVIAARDAFNSDPQ